MRLIGEGDGSIVSVIVYLLLEVVHGYKNSIHELSKEHLPAGLEHRKEDFGLI